MYYCPECNFQSATLAMMGKHITQHHNIRGTEFLKMVADGRIGDSEKKKIDVNRKLGE